MQTRAAVAWKAGQALTMETVDLQGPRFGAVPGPRRGESIRGIVRF